MDTPMTQGHLVTDVTATPEKCRLDIKYVECHNQDFNQKMFLDVKYISLNHRYDTLQWYECIHTHGETWGELIPPSTNISKVNPIGGGWNR